MDIDLLKTFLEVRRTGHFGRAAENLYLTQSAVSARIRQLEQYLATTLFVRTRNNIHLTAAGERLVPHAESMLSDWERARRDVTQAGGMAARLAFASLPSIWDSWLQTALQRVRRELPGLILSVEIYSEEVLARKLLEDAVDLALCFDPPKAYELEVRDAADISLIMVSTRPGLTAEEATAGDYIYVDWGPLFRREHSRLFAGLRPAVLQTGSGRIGLDFLLANGGSTYLPEPVVKPYLDQSRLFLVAGAPSLPRTVHLAFKAQHQRRKLLDQVIELLHWENPHVAISLDPGPADP